MASYDQELIAAAQRLVSRRTGQKGRLSSARVRRSISTAYYALFHFLVEEAGLRLIGTHNDLRRRRRIFGRLFSHTGMEAALSRVRGATVDQSVAGLLRPPGAGPGAVTPPRFAHEMAAAFSDARAKRQDADYDLNKPLIEVDARLLIVRVRHAVASWRAANTPADRDFKHALCMLMLLKGKLRQD